MFFDLPTFTLMHVVLSVLGIIAGLVVVGGLMSGARLNGWTAFFLATTFLTNVTGFGFPFSKVLPPHVVARSRSSCWPCVCWRGTESSSPAHGRLPTW